MILKVYSKKKYKKLKKGKITKNSLYITENYPKKKSIFLSENITILRCPNTKISRKSFPSILMHFGHHNLLDDY